MKPNNRSLNQIDRNSCDRHSHNQINFNQVHKQPQNLTAIKKIKNYSYAVNDQIGLGLTSRVYKGKNDLTGKSVAIKRVDIKNQNDVLAQEFLKEQIAILQKIKNSKTKHLLELQAIIRTANNLYIVTQFCQGKDMGKILRQKETLTEQQAQSVMKQMIAGYRELYAMGFIHRDLKLSNLFVTNGKIKLADFGFAIRQDQCNFGFSYNVGSPKYMPPQSLKYNKYSLKSDIWSIGIIAYELMYGQTPWKNKDDAKLYELMTTIPIDTLFNSAKSVSNHYKNFIMQCLQPNPTKRPTSDYLFAYHWPLAQDFVEGFEQQIKIQEIIKIPGKNYAVFRSSNEVSYESKKPETTDLVTSSTQPTQFVLLSQLNYCIFLTNIHKSLKQLNNTNSPLFSALTQQIALTVQIIMKVLGQIACVQKNKFDTSDFQSYIKTGDWQNLKQMIVRYDIEFRNELQNNQPVKKGVSIPKTSVLSQTISQLKMQLPKHARLLDKLITFFEIRTIFSKGKPIQFAEKSNITAIVKESLVPDCQANTQAILNRLGKRLAALNL